MVVNGILQQDRLLEDLEALFPQLSVIDRREKPSHGYRAVHVIVECGGRMVEIQVRTELQHLWAAWSEALAGALDQSIKYGGGPTKIREILTTESDIIARLESRDRLLWTRSDWNMFAKSAVLSIDAQHSLSAILISLPSEPVGDLLRREQEVKDRLNREILKLAEDI